MKTWIRPLTVGQRFTANEYIAACGDTEYGMYRFTCDAGGGARGDVFVDGQNLTPGWNYYYHACGITHEASTKDEFLNGTFYYNGGNDSQRGRSVQVVVWTDGGTDVHCTTNLNQDSWEITKS